MNDKKFNNGENNNYYNKNITKIFLVILVLTSLYLIFSSPVFSIEKEKSEEQISQWIEHLREPDWRVRDIAVINLDRLPEEQKSDIVKTSLINLLEEELSGKYDNPPGEGPAEYFSDLLDAVANLRDPRSIPSLLKNIGSSRSSIHALAAIGEPAVDPILKRLSDSTEYGYIGVKEPLLDILGEMLKPKEEGYMPGGKLREKIKQSIIKALEDSKYPTDKKIEWYEDRSMVFANVRKAAVRALGNLGDADVIPIIEKVAQEDPYFLDLSKKNNYTGPEKRYIVREEATKVLEQLERKVKEDTK